jgi:hypothetical protein
MINGRRYGPYLGDLTILPRQIVCGDQVIATLDENRRWHITEEEDHNYKQIRMWGEAPPGRRIV